MAGWDQVVAQWQRAPFGLLALVLLLDRHCEVIQAFGRFPHRNVILGRHFTAAELEFLQQDGSSF
jgi:uncharacterized protein (DUF924 family)